MRHHWTRMRMKKMRTMAPGRHHSTLRPPAWVFVGTPPAIMALRSLHTRSTWGSASPLSSALLPDTLSSTYSLTPATGWCSTLFLKEEKKRKKDWISISSVSFYQSGLLNKNAPVYVVVMQLTVTAQTACVQAWVPLHSDPDISPKSCAGFESRRSTAWELAPLVTPLSWRRSPCPHSHPAWSVPPSAIRPSGSNGAMAQPKPPPQMPFSISCRWKTRAAGQWLVGQGKVTRPKINW